jgi:hypothetical protein
MGYDIGEFESLPEALQAAREAGAIGNARDERGDMIFDVEGHQDDQRFSIWIQRD